MVPEQLTKHFLASLFVAAILLAALPASASRSYAASISAEMPCAAQCSLCHLDNLGGPGRLNPFGITLRTTGMLPPETGDPVASLNLLGATDTDRDGESDVDEVRAGRSPSVPGGAMLCAEYGCGASIARPPRNGLAAGLGTFTALALGALALRRRRR